MDGRIERKMKVEIMDLWWDGTNTIMIAKIPEELDYPSLPKEEHEKEWKEFWRQKGEAEILHLGAADLKQKLIGR